jgi:hypothetical protein
MLTQTYDQQAPSGPGLVTFGAVAAGAGVVLLVVGLALSSDETYDHDKYENVPSTWGYAGRGMAISGGVGIALGLTTTILGLYRWTTPAVDNGARASNRDQPLPFADSCQPRSKARWAFSPSLGAHRVGLGLTAAF